MGAVSGEAVDCSASGDRWKADAEMSGSHRLG